MSTSNPAIPHIPTQLYLISPLDVGGDFPERPEPEILEWWSQIFELPSVAIGGITPDNCAPLIAAGADFLAVSGAVWNGDEVAAVKAFVKAIEG